MAASTSHHNSGDGGVSRISAATNVLSSDNQYLIAEIRKSVNILKGVAVDLEKDNKFDKVKQLDDAVLELLATYDDCTRFSDSVKSVGAIYHPPSTDQPTDFKRLLEDEVTKLKQGFPSDSQTNPLYRNFKQAVWNVHHEGQPMPGEEHDEVIVTNTQNNILNTKCPISGKPIVELQDPVRCMDCKHIYEKDPIMHFIRSSKSQPRCPVTGCPKILRAERLVCDPELLIEIEEMQAEGNADVQATLVEDFTELDDESE